MMNQDYLLSSNEDAGLFDARIRGRSWTAILALGLLAAAVGCQGINPLAKNNLQSDSNPWTPDAQGEVALAGGAEPAAQAETDIGTRLVNFVTGKQVDATKGQQLYKQADQVFRDAAQKPREQAVDSFKQSAKLFRKAGDLHPGSALEQDSLFMQGESLFFADKLTEASKVYEKLQKDYPRNRHNDRVASRLFAISRYWIDAARAGDDSWFSLNLTDAKLPTYDAKGHAIRVLDQIRYDDPTGRLADDATMAAAAEYIRQENFEKADEFLTDLRETFTDSDHMFLAHLLGLRCKLELYAGPKYSGLVLEEADDLVKKTRQRFPDQMRNKKYNEMIARAASEVAFHHSERLADRAQYRENRKEFGAAREYYRRILRDYPNTPQADTARKRLAQIETLPSVPEQKLAWLTEVFPSAKKTTPLETVDAVKQAPESKQRGGTMWR